MKWDRPGVAVYPGLNTLMRMSRPLRSTIQVRANERTAALLALYTEQSGKTLDRHHRADEDHRGASGKQRQRLLHGKQQTAHVGVERLVEMLLSDLPKGAKFVNPGINHQHVDAPGLRSDGFVDAVEVGEVSSVAADRCDIALDRSNCLIQFRLTAAGDKQPRAFFRKTFGDAEPDAGAAAGDDSNFAREFAGYKASPFGDSYCAGLGGTLEKSESSPSAIVGCASMASRSRG
jgi:hypothetical protein